jgi:hypothetical protein
MSTLSVTNLKNAASATNNIVLATDGSVSISGNNYSPQTGFKNRIINGAMTIDQRNAGALVNPLVDTGFIVDRFRYFQSQTSKLSGGRNAGAITPPVGYSNYLGVTSLSAYSITSSDYFITRQNIEGFNSADLAWGTASAATVTLSFWVRSSLTGTFGGSLQNSSGNRSYPFAYTISAANTWEYETITIAGDTSGTWLTDNGVGVTVNFGFGVGSTQSGTAGAWSGSGFLSATGATSVVGTNGATFYITGVQLEKGSVATPFEFRSIGTELGLCQRYAFVTDRSTGIAGFVTIQNSQVSQRLSFPVQMRADPTASIATAGKWTVSDDRLADYEAATFTIIGITSSTQMARVIIGGFTATPAAGTTLGSMPYGGSDGKILFSSEL